MDEDNCEKDYTRSEALSRAFQFVTHFGKKWSTDDIVDIATQFEDYMRNGNPVVKKVE